MDACIFQLNRMNNMQLNKLSATANDLTDQATESAHTVVQATHKALLDASDGLSHTLKKLTDSATRATDSTACYIRNDPIKSVLIAAAAGAAAATLVGMLSRTNSKH
jgi:ElaB/YqjD/DUF883 family membrane-anchored ribosome-binding protein